MNSYEVQYRLPSGWVTLASISGDHPLAGARRFRTRYAQQLADRPACNGRFVASDFSKLMRIKRVVP